MNYRKPVLIIIAGPNGSGKTTITRQLLLHEWGEDCIYINPDDVAKDRYGDWNSNEAVMKAAKYATELRYSLLEKGEDFVFETVLSAEEKVDFIRKAKELGYFIRVFFVSTSSPKINAARREYRNSVAYFAAFITASFEFQSPYLSLATSSGFI